MTEAHGSIYVIFDILYSGNLYTLLERCYALPNDSRYIKRLLNVQ